MTELIMGAIGFVLCGAVFYAGFFLGKKYASNQKTDVTEEEKQAIKQAKEDAENMYKAMTDVLSYNADIAYGGIRQ